ncbi:RQC domain-containing protein, partial [Planococcus sp. SIMBA_143]
LNLLAQSEIPVTKEQAIQILRGESAENILAFNLDTLSAFGTMESYLTSELNHILEELIYRGYVHLRDEQLYIVDRSRRVM